MNIYLCVVASLPGAESVESRINARHLIRKRYPPCYADTGVTIFSCNDPLPFVASVVESICDECGVGAIVVPIGDEGVYTHKIDATKCFGDPSTLDRLKYSGPLSGSNEPVMR